MSPHGDELQRLMLAKLIEIGNTDAAIDQAIAEMRIEMAERDRQIEALIAEREDVERWVSASDIATYTGKSQQWVKENGVALGGVRDGNGKTAAWLFKYSMVDQGLATLNQPSAPPMSIAPRRRKQRGDGLLPVRGKKAA